MMTKKQSGRWYLLTTMAKDTRVESVLKEIGRLSVFSRGAELAQLLSTLDDLAFKRVDGTDGKRVNAYTADEAVELGRFLYAQGAALIDYTTKRYLRAATADELQNSIEAQSNGGAGVIIIKQRRCYVVH